MPDFGLLGVSSTMWPRRPRRTLEDSRSRRRETAAGGQRLAFSGGLTNQSLGLKNRLDLTAYTRPEDESYARNAPELWLADRTTEADSPKADVEVLAFLAKFTGVISAAPDAAATHDRYLYGRARDHG
jgi:hypothetical protein